MENSPDWDRGRWGRGKAAIMTTRPDGCQFVSGERKSRREAGISLDPRLRGDDRANGSLCSLPRGHFCDRTHFTRVLMSSSFTCEFGGIGTWPHTPTPPSFTFLKSFASAPLSPLYLAAT